MGLTSTFNDYARKNNLLKEKDRAKPWLKLRTTVLDLTEKLKYLTFSVGAVVFLSIAANMLVAFFGLGGFGNILKSNSRSLAFWTAMDEESAAFDRFIQEQTKETRQEWEKSAKHTELMLEELPYKYKEIGKVSGRYS